MAEIRAFRGIRYDSRVAGDLNQIISPPYDVIGAELQEELYRRSPYNVVRIDFGRQHPTDSATENRYTRASALFSEWLRDGVLASEEQPALYYQEEDYRDEDGALRTRKGFIASVRLEDAESGIYRPHEKTLAKPKEDRIALTKACRANLSPIFSLYDDPQLVVLNALETAAKRQEPALTVCDAAGVATRLWVVTDAAAIAATVAGMRGKSFFIADGHHRYETGLAYRDFMRQQEPEADAGAPWNHVMMYLSNMHEPGLTIFPTHRAVFGLEDFSLPEFLTSCEEFFAVEEVATGGAEALLERMRAAAPAAHCFGVCAKGQERTWLLQLRDLAAARAHFGTAVPEVLQSLDVTLLHSLLLARLLGIDEEAQVQQRNLSYVKGTPELLRRVEEDPNIQLGFLLNPTRIDEVKQVAEAGYRMPQKSTFFYPKLVTGLVLHPLADPLAGS